MRKISLFCAVMLCIVGCDSPEKQPNEDSSPIFVKPIIATPVIDSPKSSSLSKRACMKKIQSNEVNRVIVYRDGYENGTGGFYQNKQGAYLMTASHLFQKEQKSEWSLSFHGETYYVSKKDAFEDDVVIMALSKKKQVFTGFSPYRNVNGHEIKMAHELIVHPNEKPQYLHSLCGDKYQRLGFWTDSTFHGSGIIFRKKSIPGESGSVFVDDNGNAYILIHQWFADAGVEYSNLGVKIGEDLSIAMPLGFSLKLHVERNGYTIIPSPWKSN